MSSTLYIVSGIAKTQLSLLLIPVPHNPLLIPDPPNFLLAFPVKSPPSPSLSMAALLLTPFSTQVTEFCFSTPNDMQFCAGIRPQITVTLAEQHRGLSLRFSLCFLMRLC